VKFQLSHNYFKHLKSVETWKKIQFSPKNHAATWDEKNSLGVRDVKHKKWASGLINFSTLSNFFVPFFFHRHHLHFSLEKYFAVYLHISTFEIYYSCCNFYIEEKTKFCHVSKVDGHFCIFLFKNFLTRDELEEIDNGSHSLIGGCWAMNFWKEWVDAFNRNYKQCGYARNIWLEAEVKRC
jgi:hypothetical protein